MIYWRQITLFSPAFFRGAKISLSRPVCNSNRLDFVYFCPAIFANVTWLLLPMKWIVETKENVYANGQERERKKTDLLDKLIIRVSSRDVPDLHLSIHNTRSLDLVWRNWRVIGGFSIWQFSRQRGRKRILRDLIHCSRKKNIQLKTRERKKLSIFHSPTTIKLFIISLLFIRHPSERERRSRICSKFRFVPSPPPVVIIKSCFYEQINVKLIAASYLPAKQWAHNLSCRCPLQLSASLRRPSDKLHRRDLFVMTQS